MGKFKFFFVTVTTIFVLGLVFGCRQQPVSAVDTWSKTYEKYKKEFNKNIDKFTANEIAWFRADLQYAHYYPHDEKIVNNDIETVVFGILDILTYNDGYNYEIYKNKQMFETYHNEEYYLTEFARINEEICIDFMLLWAKTCQELFTANLVRNLNTNTNEKYSFIRIIYEDQDKNIHVCYVDPYKYADVVGALTQGMYYDPPYTVKQYWGDKINMYYNHKDTIWIEGKEY